MYSDWIRLLVVDDDAFVRHSMSRLLRKFEVVCVPSAEVAIEMLEQGLRCDAIISDYVMPGMSGADLYRRVAELRPSLATCFVLVTGSIRDLERQEPDVAHVPRFQKPFLTSDLEEMVYGLVATDRKDTES